MAKPKPRPKPQPKTKPKAKPKSRLQSELLLEITSEEIPARMQAQAADDLKRWMSQILHQKAIGFQTVESFITPRRLVLVVHALRNEQAVTGDIKHRGPRADAPQKAIDGFKRSLPKGASVQILNTEKGAYFFVVTRDKVEKTERLLPGIINDALMLIAWPKSMRWADHGVRWVRPIHRILCLFGSKVVPVTFGPVKAGDMTTGHPFLAPKPFKVKDFEDYKAKLKQAKVVLDPKERRESIRRQAEELAREEGLRVREDKELLGEVTGLVEWPVALIGAIDEDFMTLPPEVLITAMRLHQKYFALEDANGAMAPRFITIADNETADGGKDIIAGNERVLRARLADAKFFWDQDRKQRLEERVPKLDEVVFHANLGTMAEKAGRMEALATGLCEYVPNADGEPARTATRLSKADLVTAMVAEFPELQGVIGRYYALGDGVGEDVARAIAEHYAPLGPADECPTAPLSVVVALADKIDTLVGFWAIDEKPTGSRDPFALRRAALGVIRLIVENRLRVPLRVVFDSSKEAFKFGAVAILNVPGWGKIDRDVLSVLDFFADRLKVQMRADGVRHDLIEAVFALGGEDDLVRLLARVEALTAFLETDDGADLLTAYKRASNIVSIEEKRDGKSYADAPEAGDFRQDEETALHASLGASMKASSVALKGEDFTAVMGELAKLRAPVDAFFDEVTVNCDDPKLRQNRLRLLSQIRATLGNVADFSRIEG